MKAQSKKYSFVWPKINKEIEKAVIKQLHTSISIYDGGGIFKDFENKFAKYHGRKFAVLCNSGTNAIHSMFVAADFKEGDEVICPAYTFFATVTPLLFTGAKPILCDCDENGNINPVEILKKINKKTKAVVVAHMWGVPAQMDKIVSICKKNNLLLLEDCSHAHGASFNNKKVGSFGDLSAWSLQGPKIISGGEAGIFTTNNRNFYERALLLGHYNKRCFREIGSESKWSKYKVTGMGLKYRAHPLAIAIASKLFDNIEKNAKIRDKYARKLVAHLKDNNNVQLPPAYFDKRIKPSWYAFTFFVNNDLLKNGYLENKISECVSSGLVDIDNPGSTKPLNLLPLFQNASELFPIYKNKNNYFSYREGDFPQAEKLFKSLLKMPVGTDKEDNKIMEIYIKGIKKIF
ncbi:MAG: DegT/DnrJ/EryC1/StrS family aminotransferase [Candidatus Falkowbacteria bacterium]